MKLIGPFKQIVTLNNLPLKGAIKDEQLEIIENGAILLNNTTIEKVGNFETLSSQCDPKDTIFEILEEDYIALPGLIDAHTHICFAGTRAKDYAARNNGKTYLEIAAAGGGIWDTVKQTRAASINELVGLMEQRLKTLKSLGITTVEVKSGYGLGVQEEVKLLQAIRNVSETSDIDIVSTCLAAHIIPKEYASEQVYLDTILSELVPLIQKEKLTNRFDIFVEKEAFTEKYAITYLKKLKAAGFDITVHGDQFTTSGSQVAIECGALSVDHLEASGEKEIAVLAESDVIPVVLPGASIGLGCAFAPARKLLDAGCSLAIASDWNPGSAPQGNLLFQAAVCGTFEKLSAAEIFSGITFRAAKALNLTDRGRIVKGQLGDIAGFQTADFREILYHQGNLKPSKVWKKGVLLF